MRKIFWFFLTLCIMLTMISSVSAAEACVYVSDGGKGDGSSAASPLGSLTEAYKRVLDGGEIVIVGTVTVPLHKGDTTRTSFTEPEHGGKITLRGQNKDSVLRFASVYEYHLSGETELKDLTVSSGSYANGIFITARGYHLTMGEGLAMHSKLKVEGEVGTKIYLLAGCISGATRKGYESMDTHVTVKSGEYWGIDGFNRNLNVTSTGKATIEIGGNVHTRFLIAGSTGTCNFAEPAGCDIYVTGDLSISKQISLGNQNSDVSSFDTDLILTDGVITFTGDFIDYNARNRLTSLDVFVNEASSAALKSYSALFAGYGDSEGTLADYCKSVRGSHKFEKESCTVCGISRKAAECTSHSFEKKTAGTVVTSVCSVCGFSHKSTDRTDATDGVYTYTDGTLRVRILSDGIVRIEESEQGKFNDKSTLVAAGTDHAGARVVRDEDGETVILKTDAFTVNIPKNDPTVASVRIFDNDGKLIYSYLGSKKHGFYASLPAPSETPDAFVLMDNGIIPADGGLTYNGGKDLSSGWTRTENTDLYVLLPLGDSAALRRQFVELTGRTMLSDIKALGSWYSKWTNYTANEKLAMIERYRTREIPLDMIVIDTEWKNTSTGGNGGDGTGYDVNTELYPDMEGFLTEAEENGVLVLFNDHTHKTSAMITYPTELKWQSNGITSLMKLGLDGWWYDRNWTYGIKSPYADVLFSTLGQVLYYDTMAKYHAETKEGSYPERVLMLSNVDWIKHGHITGEPSVIGHRYGVQWTGDIYGDPLQLRREIENMVIGGVNGASPYMSSDLGGFWHNDTVTRNNFVRWMQYGAFSPVVRVHSTLSAKNEQLPWSYGTGAQKIIKDYLDMRYHLMPYYYMLARENYESGMPLMRRLDFHYPQYEEAKDNTQYLIGEDILVAPFWSTEGDGQYAVPSSWLKTKDGREGLEAEYFNSAKGRAKETYFRGSPVYTEVVPNLDYYWYTGSPNAKVNADYFAARYTGTITPEFDCYIGTLADDGARVYIDGKLWSDGYASSQVKPYLNNKEHLEAGKTYELTVEYYELSGKAILYFVCEPVLGKNMSSRTVFIPDGTWINAFTGEETVGPKTITVTADINEMPVFVRKGAAIPVSNVISPMDGADWSELSVNIYGLADTSFELYEDDGETEAYTDGIYRKTPVSVSTLKSDVWQIDVGAAKGSFVTEESVRKLKLRVHSASPITEATADGAAVAITRMEREAEALPFANSGASNIGEIYEIEISCPMDKGVTVLLTTGTLSSLTEELLPDTDGPAVEEDHKNNPVGVALGIAAGCAVCAGAAALVIAKGKKDKKSR